MTDPEQTPSFAARLDAWSIYFPRMVRHPFFGQGVLSAPLSFVDNEYLMRGATTGVIGILSFFWVFGRLARKAFELFKHSTDTFSKQLGLGYFSALLGMLVQAMAITSFTTVRTAEPIYFFAGLIIAENLLKLDIEPGDSRDEIQEKGKQRAAKSSVYSPPHI
jgi:O-antigen ligase